MRVITILISIGLCFYLIFYFTWSLLARTGELSFEIPPRATVVNLEEVRTPLSQEELRRSRYKLKPVKESQQKIGGFCKMRVKSEYEDERNNAEYICSEKIEEDMALLYILRF